MMSLSSNCTKSYKQYFPSWFCGKRKLNLAFKWCKWETSFYKARATGLLCYTGTINYKLIESSLAWSQIWDSCFQGRSRTHPRRVGVSFIFIPTGKNYINAIIRKYADSIDMISCKGWSSFIVMSNCMQWFRKYKITLKKLFPMPLRKSWIYFFCFHGGCIHSWD